jgi:methionyl-tRNA synthetase
MTQENRFYVTTPLYYVNDKPHVGHAYTTIAADVLARWNRFLGKEVFFLTGTDEHGQKVLDAAAARELSPLAHADQMCLPFQELWKQFDITNNDFIRTTQTRHTKSVQDVLQYLFEKGDIYEDSYEGWYSTSVERFWTEKDLVDGKCPETGNKVEWISEKNYFFRMSKYGEKLEQWIADHPGFLRPESRKNEVLGYLKKELGDLCISRPKSRLNWGIELPFDSDFVTYVWFDALLNYITALGYHTDPEQRDPKFAKFWPATCQIMGKDILTTHSVYWSTMLFALDLTPTNMLFAHGWWKVEGKKMSKSIGNVVDPNLLIRNYSSDVIRYILLKEIPFGVDGNFSHQGLLDRYNAELANDLGNLLHRSLSMTERWLEGKIPALDADTEEDLSLNACIQKSHTDFCMHIQNLAFSKALDSLWILVRRGNKYIDNEQPWRLAKNNPERLPGVMRRCLEICRAVAQHLAPFMPNKSAELLEKLHYTSQKNELASLSALTEGTAVEAGKPLFPKMKTLPQEIKDILGIEDKPKTPAKPTGPKKIKIKVFQRVPFQSGIVSSIVHDEQNSTLQIDVGKDEHITIRGPKTNATEGQMVAVVGASNREDFAKIVLKTAIIEKANPHPDPEASKLLHLSINNGEEAPRSVVAGIANRFSPQDLLGQKVTLVSNLKPSKLRGVPSLGMLLAAGGERLQSLVVAPSGTPCGSTLKWYGEGKEFGLLSVENNSLMTLSEDTTPGSVIR